MRKFSIRQTQILKGIAIGLLLVHHGLDPIPKENMGVWAGIVENSISLSKLCVAIFAVLSGYGMYLSFHGKQRAETGMSVWRFVFSHILKLYAVFWMTALLSIGIVTVIKGNFGEIYEGYPLYYALLDVMGLSYLTVSPKFVNSWWYVTATLIYYCLFPLLFPMVQRLKRGNYLLLAVTAAGVFGFPGMNSILIYGCSFLYGMIFAERDIINRLLNCLDKNRMQSCLKLVGCFLIMIGLCAFRQKVLAETKTAYYLDWLLALVLILLVSELTSRRLPARAGILELTGRYSFEIYLIHAVFIRHMGKYVYLSNHCWAVLLRLFAASFGAALLLRWMERRFHFGGIPSWCQERKKRGPGLAAGLLAGIVLLLMLPEFIANMGIGKLTFYKEEISMENGTWHVPLYVETPLFWELANKRYSSEKWDMVSFVDGVLYAHYPGQTEVTVSLPLGKSVSCVVTVE